MEARGAAGLLTLIIVFELSAFSLLAFRDSNLIFGAFLFRRHMVALLLFQYITLTSIIPACGPIFTYYRQHIGRAGPYYPVPHRRRYRL
jgi:hypothetical protein